jgi:hypothetical protein
VAYHGGGPTAVAAHSGRWKEMHNKELYNLYSTPGIIRVIKLRIRWAGHVACMGEIRKPYKILICETERKKPLAIPRRRWEDNIKLDLTAVGYEDVNWIHVAKDRSIELLWLR